MGRPHPIDEPYGFATRAVHAGAKPDPVTGSRNMPIHQTTSYVFDDADHAAALFNLQTFGYIYSRLTNPTVAALEERVAALEGGRAAVAAASGHAAQLLAFYTLLEPGDHVVAARQLYGGSLTQLRHTFGRLGWSATFVDATEPAAVAAAIERADQGRVRRVARQPGRRRRRPRGAGGHRARRVDPAHRRQHARDPLPVPAVRVGRGPRRPLADQVPVRSRDVDGRDPRRVRAVRLEGERQVPVPRRPGRGVPRARLLRDVRRLRVLDEGAGRRAARPRAGPVADERVPHPHRHRDAAAADGAPRGERARRRGATSADHPAVAWVSYAGLPSSPVVRAAPGGTCRGGRARCSRSASAAATRPASASSSRSTSGRTSPTSATPAA